jgi:hypothetical protein
MTTKAKVHRLGDVVAMSRLGSSFGAALPFEEGH